MPEIAEYCFDCKQSLQLGPFRQSSENTAEVFRLHKKRAKRYELPGATCLDNVMVTSMVTSFVTLPGVVIRHLDFYQRYTDFHSSDIFQNHAGFSDCHLL